MLNDKGHDFGHLLNRVELLFMNFSKEVQFLCPCTHIPVKNPLKTHYGDSKIKKGKADCDGQKSFVSCPMYRVNILI